MNSCWLYLLLLMNGGKMKSDNPARGPLGLSGEQYWEQPLFQKPARDFGSDLVDRDVDGIFIDCPPKVYLDRYIKVPLACLRSGSTAKLHKHNFATTARLAVAHLETGRIKVVKPAIPGPNPEPAPDSPGWTTDGVEVDLADIMDLGPKMGRYSVLILEGPETSNKCLLTLSPSEKSEGSQEFRQRLKDLRTLGGPPQPLTVGKILDLKQETGIPQKDAYFLKLSSIQEATGDRIRLDYRLEVPPRLVFSRDKPRLDEAGKRIYATLPVTWLGFNEERGVVVNKELGLPVANPSAGDPDQPVLQGSISLSLEKLLGSRPTGKTLYLWALVLDRQALVEIPVKLH